MLTNNQLLIRYGESLSVKNFIFDGWKKIRIANLNHQNVFMIHLFGD